MTETEVRIPGKIGYERQRFVEAEKDGEVQTLLLKAAKWCYYRLRKDPLVAMSAWPFKDAPFSEQLLEEIALDIRAHTLTLESFPAGGITFTQVRYPYEQSIRSRKKENFSRYVYDRMQRAIRNAKTVYKAPENAWQVYSCEPIAKDERGISDAELLSLGDFREYPRPAIPEERLTDVLRDKDLLDLAAQFWLEAKKRSGRGRCIGLRQLMGYLAAHYASLRIREDASFDEAFHQDLLKTEDGPEGEAMKKKMDKAFLASAEQLLECEESWKMAFLLQWTLDDMKPTDKLVSEICECSSVRYKWTQLKERCGRAILELGKDWEMDYEAQKRFLSLVLDRCRQAVGEKIVKRLKALGINEERLQW